MSAPSSSVPSGTVSAGGRKDEELLLQLLSSLLGSGDQLSAGSGGGVAAAAQPPVMTRMTVDAAAVVREVAAAIVPSASIDESLTDYGGLDSLGAVEFRSRLSQQLNGAEMPETLIFDHPTVRQLEMHVGAQYSYVEEVPQPMSAAMPAAIPQIAPAPVMPSQPQAQSQAHVPIREPSSQVSAQGAPPPTPASHLLPHSHLGSSSGTSLRPAPAPMSRAAPTKSPGVSALQPPLPLSTWTSEFGVALLQEILLAHGPPKAAEWSLFAPDDPVLRRAQRGRAPYAKHLLQRTADGKFTFQPTQKGWTVGRKAAESGLEYRAFFEPGAESRRTFGAVRFSSSARADEDGFDDYVHGGAIQSLLDEATAECAMVTVCVLPTTAEASFKIVRKVVPDRSLLFECEVVEETVPNLKFKVVGRLLDPQGDFLLAKCTATIANIGAIPEARRERYGE